jgi:hypothetical protein
MAQLDRLLDRYLSVLVDQMGVDAEPVDEGSLAFEIGGLNLLLFLEERDPEFLQVVAVFPPPEQDIEPDELARICLQVSREAKVAKVVVDEEGDLFIQAELIVAGPDLMPSAELLAGILPRTVSTIFHALNRLSTALELAGISRATSAGEGGAFDGGSAEGAAGGGAAGGGAAGGGAAGGDAADGGMPGGDGKHGGTLDRGPRDQGEGPAGR